MKFTVRNDRDRRGMVVVVRHFGAVRRDRQGAGVQLDEQAHTLIGADVLRLTFRIEQQYRTGPSGLAARRHDLAADRQDAARNGLLGVSAAA